jgi:hypothetical protein
MVDASCESKYFEIFTVERHIAGRISKLYCKLSVGENSYKSLVNELGFLLVSKCRHLLAQLGNCVTDSFIYLVNFDMNN